MKKLLLSLFAFMLLVPLAHAGECEKITDVNDYWVRVTSGVNMRDKVCEGNVVGSLSAGSVVKVVGHIEDWRYIETPDGGNAFIWSDFVENTSAPAEAANNEALFDVKNHRYETAVRYLESNGIISGYPDGSFKPENSVNRAEFTKIIVEAKLGQNPTASASSCFPDVKSSDWFASYVCYAKNNDIISGYPDGTFKPGDTINLAEASKILINTMGVEAASTTSVWYEAFIGGLQDKAYIPSTLNAVDDLVSRSEMAEMIWRIREKKTKEPSRSFTLSASNSSSTSNQTSAPANESGNVNACLDDHIPNAVDMTEVRADWLKWHNAARSERGQGALTMNEGLDYVSTLWALENEAMGDLTHDRKGGQSASDWFDSVGLKFKALSGFQFGENLGLRTYICSDNDCTDEMSEAAKFIFDAFMAEEGTSYTGHYDNIVEGDFNELGLGIAIDESENIIYLATHYAQGVESYPDTCQ